MLFVEFLNLIPYENLDITNIPSDKIEKLAVIYKTTPSYLMGWEDEIRLRIKNLIKKYNTSDPAILCIYDDLGDLKGYYKHPQGRKVIVVNSLLSKFAQIIVLARELGHAILHSGSTVALMHRYIAI